jgi:uncharacterized membrane protein YqaE (UPF0057 family)
MKQILLSGILALFLVNISFAEVTMSSPVSAISQSDEVKALSPEMTKMAVDQFLNLTPAKYKEMTGERLGLKKTVQLKMAQKAVKKHMRKHGTDGADGITKGLYILLAFLGWAWLVMGLKDDWNGSDWVVNLILYLLCWLPGFIHALVKMKKYYS